MQQYAVRQFSPASRTNWYCAVLGNRDDACRLSCHTRFHGTAPKTVGEDWPNTLPPLPDEPGRSASSCGGIFSGKPFPDLRCFALWVAVGRHFVQPV